MRVVMCAYCTGTGFNEHDNRCEFCDGNGQIDMPDDDIEPWEEENPNA